MEQAAKLCLPICQYQIEPCRTFAAAFERSKHLSMLFYDTQLCVPVQAILKINNTKTEKKTFKLFKTDLPSSASITKRHEGKKQKILNSVAQSCLLVGVALRFRSCSRLTALIQATPRFNMHGWRTTLFLSEDYFPMCRKLPPIIPAYLKFLSFLFCFSLSAAGIHYTEAMRAFVRD